MSSEKKKTLITIIGITVIVVATIIMLPFGNVIYNCGQIKEAKNIYSNLFSIVLLDFIIVKVLTSDVFCKKHKVDETTEDAQED